MAGMIAFARYYAGLRMRCRPRTLEIAFASAHDAIVRDGMGRYSAPLDAEYDKGSIAFAFADRASGHARDPAQRRRQPAQVHRQRRAVPVRRRRQHALQEAAATATKRRKLDMTAVLKGLGLPTPGQVPPVCSMGGLGNFFHRN